MIFEIIKNAMMAALGAQEMLKEFIDALVAKGQLSEQQGRGMLNEWKEKINNAGAGINLSEIMDMALAKMSLATKDDIEKINKRLSALSQRIAACEDSRSEAGSDK
ncbi:MAG: hypothetical protein L7F77_15875 [Candidatus Magnetominusculus sp. LBB02]|nr:hypothetical protein [Candidatus Magnetominusculus sp. LBB02]